MLIAHYPLNGDARDYFGNATTVNGSSGISYADGKIGRAISFDNSDTGYLSAPEISTYLHGRAEASIALWVKKSAIQYGLLQLSGYADANGNLYPYESATKVYLDVFRTNRLGPIYMPTSVLEWHHLVITQKPGQWKLYQNGVLVNTSGANNTVSTDYLQFEIGRNSGSRYAYGDFDDVRIYDHALSEKEVSEIARGAVVHYTFNSSDVSDSTGNFTPTVNTSSQDTSVYAVGSASGLFQNDVLSNDQVFLGSDPIFSISAWIRPDTYDNSGFWGLGSSSNAISCYTTTNLNPGFDDWGSTTYYANYTLPTDRFTHIVWIKKGTGEFNSSKLEIWINGELYPLIQKRFSSSTPNVSPGLSLGRIAYNNNNYHANGNVDDFRLYATALNSNDVQTLYKTGLSIDNIGNIHSKYLDESPKVRYIRDYLNGSTSNSGEHWVEIQANDTDGVNVALNADAYDEVGNPEPELTDGNTNTSPYVSGNTYMEVDLGSVFLLDNVHIWHYYSDGRTYYGTKTEVSVDGQNWITIFDNEVDGLYPETPSGKVHQVLPASKFSVNYSGVSVGEASEVGISRGLVSWLPLIGDTKDRVTNEVATNNGAIAVGDGYEFDGVDDWIDLGLNIDQGDTSKNYTIVLWFNKSADASNRNGIFGQDDGEYDFFIQENRYSSGDLIIAVGGAIRVEEPGAILANVWHFIAVVLSGNSVLYSKNGEPLIDIGASRSNYGPTTDNLSTGTIGGSTPTGEYFTGKIKGLKLYNTALTPEEVAQEYNSGKASLNKNSAFAKEFIEV